MSGHRPKHSTPVPILSRLDPKALLARHERLLVEFDRMTTKVMLAEREVRRIGRASGRSLSRMIAAQHRAEVAESVLAAGTSAPVACARLLLRCETMLYQVSYDRCPTCRLGGTSHRYNCRLERLLTEIRELMPV